MSRTLFVGAAAVALAAVWCAPAVAQTSVATTKAQCEALWKEARGTSADVTMELSKPYVTDFKKADKNSDKKLSQIEWMDACDGRLIHSAAAPGGAGTGTGAGESGGKTSDRSPEGADARTPGATDAGAAGAEKGQTPSGTSDRTPSDSSAP